MAKSTRTVPGKTSKEATKRQLKLAKKQGEQFKNSLDAMHLETGKGKSLKVQNYLITYSEENAEGFYEWVDGQLKWFNPTDENAHMEIVVEDILDGRFVPYLSVRASIFEPTKDKPVKNIDLPFMWHPWLYHYGNNFKITSGTYDMIVYVSALPVRRHDKENGNRYTHPVEVRFNHIPITTGQKIS